MDEREPFDKWMERLDAEVRKEREDVQSFFDLRPLNYECWREAYERGESPQETVFNNVDALMSMQ